MDEAAPRTVLGYFTLAMASVTRDALPRRAVRGLPYYGLPMLLLARLAVEHRSRSRGLWEALLAKALRVTVTISGEAGCRCVIVDAYPRAVRWYARFGFQGLEGGEGNSVRMYLDIRAAKAAQEHERTTE